MSLERFAAIQDAILPVLALGMYVRAQGPARAVGGTEEVVDSQQSAVEQSRIGSRESTVGTR
jgi:hypothetical protein